MGQILSCVCIASMDETELFSRVLDLLAQIQLFHWATRSYAQHKALDELHEALRQKTDALVESYLARFHKLPVRKMTVARGELTTDVTKMMSFLEEQRNAWTAVSLQKTWGKYPELQNIVDEMVGALDRAIYLCHLT